MLDLKKHRSWWKPIKGPRAKQVPPLWEALKTRGLVQPSEVEGEDEHYTLEETVKDDFTDNTTTYRVTKSGDNYDEYISIDSRLRIYFVRVDPFTKVVTQVNIREWENDYTKREEPPKNEYDIWLAGSKLEGISYLVMDRNKTKKDLTPEIIDWNYKGGVQQFDTVVLEKLGIPGIVGLPKEKVAAKHYEDA